MRCARWPPSARRSARSARIRRRAERGAKTAGNSGSDRYPALAVMQAPPPGPATPAPPDEHPRRGLDAAAGRRSVGRVLVLNATYEPINVCSVRRAVVLLLKEKAELLE